MARFDGERAGPARPAARSVANERGFTVIELLLTAALSVTLVAIAIPATKSGVEEIRAAAAARHLASRIALARIDAVRGAATVGLRFVPAGSDYSFSAHIDGNGNGIRTTEIASGIDLSVGAAERLSDSHQDVGFGLMTGLPDLDGVRGNPDGVRVGTSRILSLSPDGSSTSGTLYVHGRRAQYAVRVLGATGRVRLYYYDTGAGRWINR